MVFESLLKLQLRGSVEKRSAANSPHDQKDNVIGDDWRLLFEISKTGLRQQNPTACDQNAAHAFVQIKISVDRSRPSAAS
jgi:hypothetical protein